MELIAESFGVFLYTFFGVGATAAFVFGGFLKEDGIGNILTIGLAYGLGIVFAIIAAAPTSGGHLSPGYTIAFAVFKGFSWKKVPLYIIAQIFGGFIAVLLVYAQYRQAFVQVDTALAAAGPAGNLIKFSPTGNAGILAIFPQTGQKLGYVFLNEFVCCFILAFLVATILDASNFFVSYTSAPWLIGLAYTVIIWGFSLTPSSSTLLVISEAGSLVVSSMAAIVSPLNTLLSLPSPTSPPPFSESSLKPSSSWTPTDLSSTLLLKGPPR